MEDYLISLMEILQAVAENPSPESVYPILQKHLEKLDENLAQILESRITDRLSQVKPEEAEYIAGVIGNFARLIKQYPLGSRANNIEIAIVAEQVILQTFRFDTFPYEWATIQNNLGNAYSQRIRGEKAENLEQAIALHQEALKIYTFEAFPYEWARSQNNLAIAYYDRIRGEKAENLEQAIATYQEALKIYTFAAFPVEWANTQNNLANAYRDRIRGEKAENLEQAIALQQEALKVYTFEAFPYEWARSQNNLANAYRKRIRGEQAENLEMAITAYQEALKVRTFEAFPVDWARSQNNLAIAYTDRIRGENAENLEQAIATSQDALKVYTFEAFPRDWAITQNNLANAYSQRIRGEKAENLEVAIAAYQEALKVYIFEAFPEDWANTQNNLANAYSQRIRGEKAENLEQAIAAYQEALKVHTFEAFPYEWAKTQGNLTIAYRERIRGEQAENIERAIIACQEALKVYTFEAFPVEWARTQGNLAIAYQNAQQFSNAYTAYKNAIKTVEFLRAEIVLGSEGEEDKQKLAEQWNVPYQNMVKVCLELGYDAQAIQYVESSKTRNLVELLATRALDPKGKIPEARKNELQQLRQKIQELDAENRLLQRDKNAKPDYTLVNKLRQRYNELYPFKPISFDQIQTLIDDRTAMIQWYISGKGFYAFIVTRQHQQPIPWSSSAEDLENLQKWGDEYLQAYNTPRQAKTVAEQKTLQQQWENSIASRLQDLADILHINKILSHISIDIDQLLLVPHIYLHLFPLHALPVDSENCLLDRFSRGVRYTPSCQLLQQVQQQPHTEFQRFFAIQTPTEDLYELDLGIVRAIQSQFTDDSPILKRDKATKSAILNHPELQSTHSAFFFCHGYFNSNSALDSGLQLADDVLTLEEIIAHFDLKNCRLVTLAACETGLTDFTKITDEYIGLPSGFLLAGSTNVVCSLWPVNSLPTALIMLRFYQELQRQASIAVALNTAQLWLRDTTVQGFQTWLPDSKLSFIWQAQLTQYFNTIEKEQGATAKPFQSSYHWAAFCAIGKGE